MEFEIKHKEKNYAYGFECNNNEITEEWLFEINKETDKPIFERKAEGSKSTYDFSGIKFSTREEEQFIKFTSNGTRKNQLFITECKVRNVRDNVSTLEDIFNVLDWFQNVLKIIFPNTKYQQGLEFELRDNQNIYTIFHEFLEYFNTGIKGVDFEDISIEDIPGLPPDLKGQILQDTSEAKRIFISDPFRNITYAINRNEKGDLKVFKMMTPARRKKWRQRRTI